MPQIDFETLKLSGYLLVYAIENDVPKILIGKKRNNQLSKLASNNGQHVIPGGKYDSKYDENNLALTTIREFQEETFTKLVTDDTNTNDYILTPNKKTQIPIKTIHIPSVQLEQEFGYLCTLIELKSYADLETLKAEISQQLSKENIQESEQKSKNVELETIEAMTLEQARQLFEQENTNAPGEKNDWFISILAALVQYYPNLTAAINEKPSILPNKNTTQAAYSPPSTTLSQIRPAINDWQIETETKKAKIQQQQYKQIQFESEIYKPKNNPIKLCKTQQQRPKPPQQQPGNNLALFAQIGQQRRDAKEPPSSPKPK